MDANLEKILTVDLERRLYRTVRYKLDLVPFIRVELWHVWFWVTLCEFARRHYSWWIDSRVRILPKEDSLASEVRKLFLPV